MTKLQENKKMTNKVLSPSALGELLINSSLAHKLDYSVGGKADKLAILTHAGFDVPAWFCVNPTLLQHAISFLSDDMRSQLANLTTLSTTEIRNLATSIQTNLVSAINENNSFLEQLESTFDKHFSTQSHLAIRSSAIGEDSSTDSFAGQMDTYLFVDKGKLANKIAQCLSSAFGMNALLYRKSRSIEATEISSSAIIQEMVHSKTSGVLFTQDPNSALKQMVIVAGLGLGEGVVDGVVNTDTYFLDHVSGEELKADIGNKSSAASLNTQDGEGTKIIDVSQHDAESRALSDKQIENLFQQAKNIEALFKCPQDIEWAFDEKGKLWILQSRPITTLSMGRETIYDNSNIVESFPGVCSPLTFSIARAGYEEVFRKSSLDQGMPKTLLEQDPGMHANLLGTIQGRIYYNLTNWYKRFDNIPGAKSRIKAMEKGLGLQPRDKEPEDTYEFHPIAKSYYQIRGLWRKLNTLVFLNRRVDAYLRLFDKQKNEFNSLNVNDLDAHELVQQAEQISVKLLRPYTISIANDGFSQLFYSLLEKKLIEGDIEDAPGLINGLMCAQQGVESVAPVRSMIKLAETAKRVEGIKELIQSDQDVSEIWTTLTERSGFSEFATQARKHFDEYGDRMIHELKIETPKLEENPTFIITVLRNYLTSAKSVEQMEAHELQVRADAESALSKEYRGNIIHRTILNYIIKMSRLTIVNRENLRLARSQGMGMLRTLYDQLGEQFSNQKLINKKQDIVYLSKEEIAGIIYGTSLISDVTALIESRQRDHEDYKTMSPAPRITFNGIVQACHVEQKAKYVRNNINTLQGVGCSQGVIEGYVKVIAEPRDDMVINGEILIAPSTDPGWVFLMVSAGGLISEKGSVLSHTAIIGRELGIPTIVGIDNALELFQEGDYIRMDGKSGMITILEKAEDTSLATSTDA
jgi:pyruvate,water dikinase